MLKIINPLAWLIAFTALIFPALENGFPLIYSDTGTYLIAAFSGDIPIDRPILYSYFIRWSSLGISLFVALSIQIIIVLHILYLFLSKVFEIKYASIALVGLVLPLSVSTALANTSSQLMPDIFSALLFLLVILLVKLQKPREVLLVAFYLLLCIGVHTTDMLLFAALLPIIVLIYRRQFKKPRLLKILVFYVLGICFIPLLNYGLKGEFFLSKSSGLFLSASLMEMGVGQEYLDRNCPDAPVFLCKTKHPQEGGTMAFLWSENSPLIDSACMLRGGWGRCWEEKNDTMKVFVRNVLTDRQSLYNLIPKVAEAFTKQFFLIEVGLLTKQAEYSAVYTPLKEHYSSDFQSYQSANQYKEDLYFEGLSKRQFIFILLCLIAIPLLYVYGKRKSKNYLMLILLCVLFLAINAFVCGVLSNPVSRYQARVVWLIPFLTMAWAWSLTVENWLRLKLAKV